MADRAPRYPGESDEYRRARDELLKAELDLRQKVADVAALRSNLPMGGAVKEDYVFDEVAADGSASKTKLSELFADGKESLILYSFMYGPDSKAACPACTSFLDTANASVSHVEQRVNFAVVARSPTQRIRDWAKERGWDRLRLLSSANNDYNRDYFATAPDGSELPACNVFVKTSDGIFHFWSAETLYAKVEGHPRHMDLLWPIWSYFDIVPEGRGDFFPQLSYS